MNVYDTSSGFSEAIAFWRADAIPEEGRAGATTEFLAALLEVKYGYETVTALGIAEGARNWAAYLKRYQELNQRSDQNG